MYRSKLLENLGNQTLSVLQFIVKVQNKSDCVECMSKWDSYTTPLLTGFRDGRRARGLLPPTVEELLAVDDC